MAAAFALCAPGYGCVIVQLNAADVIYDNLAGSLADTDAGPAAKLDPSVYGAFLTLDLTHAPNVTDLLFGAADQPVGLRGGSLETGENPSGEPAGGTSCAAKSSTACLETSGASQDDIPPLDASHGG